MITERRALFWRAEPDAAGEVGYRILTGGGGRARSGGMMTLS